MQRSMQTLEITMSFDGAVLDVHNLDGDKHPHFTIGSEAGCDAIVPELAPVRLAAWDGVNATVFVPDGARLFVEEGAALREVDVAAQRAHPVRPGTRAVVELGTQLFALRIIDRAVVCPPGSRLDWRTEAPTAITGVAALLLLAAAFAVPPEPRTLALDPDLLLRRATFEVKPKQEEDKPLAMVGKPGGAERAAGKNGRAGEKSSKLKQWSPPARNGVASGDIKLMANELAQKSGVLGQLKALEGSSTGLVFSRQSVFGDPASKAMDGLVATDAPTGFGNGGMGDDGDGPGGGGKSLVSIGLDRLPTGGKFGPGGPGGDGPGIKTKLREHKTQDVEPQFTPGDVKGGLDKEIIRRVIRRHMNEVRFCYERQLLSVNQLAGRLKVQFTINASGQVITSITEQSIGNVAVDRCVNEAVRRWEFPRPSTSLVSVGYSFYFKAAGN